MPHCSVYFSLSILDMGFTLPRCWYQLGVCVCVCVALSASACAHAETCLCVCVCPWAISHAIPLPRLTRHNHTTLMSLSDGNFHANPLNPFSSTHCQHHVHIYIGVWHRYRSKTVAGDLSLSLSYVVILHQQK